VRAPYDWELERDRRRFYDKVAVWSAYIVALALAPIGVYFLTVGLFVGWLVLVLAVAVWLVAWGFDR